MYAKVHEKGRDILLAACDKELIGKELRDDFTVAESFYKGKIVTKEEMHALMDEMTIANLIGERVINAAKEKELVRDEHVILVNGVPHAQIVRML